MAILAVPLHSANVGNMNFSRLQKAAGLNEALRALIFELILTCIALAIIFIMSGCAEGCFIRSHLHCWPGLLVGNHSSRSHFEICPSSPTLWLGTLWQWRFFGWVIRGESYEAKKNSEEILGISRSFPVKKRHLYWNLKDVWELTRQHQNSGWKIC